MFCFKIERSNSVQTNAVLDWVNLVAVMVKHDVTKTSLSLKKNRRFFLKVLMADVKLMLGKVLKVSRRYLPPFSSYGENPAGGGEFAYPPERGA